MLAYLIRRLLWLPVLLIIVSFALWNRSQISHLNDLQKENGELRSRLALMTARIEELESDGFPLPPTHGFTGHPPTLNSSP